MSRKRKIVSDSCEEEVVKSAKLDLALSPDDIIIKPFDYTIIFDKTDPEIFEKWTRADDARRLHVHARAVFVKHNGEIPEGLTIDHINRNCFDNRISNLRATNLQTQLANRRMARNNSSGHTGVWREKNNGKTEHWKARVQKNGQNSSKLFPFTEQGLSDACAFYRTALADGSVCPTCHPELCTEEKLDLTQYLSRTFHYNLVYEKIDMSIYATWQRGDDVRHAEKFTQQLATKLFGKYDRKTLSVDHIDINMFNNLRKNLRLATQKEQVQNQRIRRTNTSGHRGVSISRKTVAGKKYIYWIARGTRFPYTSEGLIAACEYHHNSRKNGQVCDTGHPSYTLTTLGTIIDEDEDYVIYCRD